MKGRFVNAMVNEISHHIQCDPQLHQMMAVGELTFVTTLHYDNTCWSRYMLDKGFTRIRELGDSLYDGKLASIIFPININGVHWMVFLVDAKNREIRYGDSLDWPWLRADVDSIQRWLCKHGFRLFSQGTILPHGCQEDAYSCTIAMINIICHQFFNTPLFMDEKKDLFCIQELILILHAHFSEDNDAWLLKHFSIVSCKDHLADIHQCDLEHKDKQRDAIFSAALKDTEHKYQKCLNDRNRQRACQDRVKECYELGWVSCRWFKREPSFAKDIFDKWFRLQTRRGSGMILALWA
ncbi:hypothetical protein EDD22DRAFT_1022080 [Suillus occidentalis]|nr:hypothetical protein EDD22DRAFT_1022080 [Suillus occidentalis]